MIGISVTALMDINVMLVQVNIFVLVQFPVSDKTHLVENAGTNVAGPANLRSGWSEAKDWLQRLCRAEAERHQGQHRLAGSQVLLPNQVNNLLSRLVWKSSSWFVLTPDPMCPFFDLLVSTSSQEKRYLLLISQFLSPHANITVQRALFRMTYLWVWVGLVLTFQCVSTVIAFHKDISWCPMYCNHNLNRDTIFQHHDMTSKVFFFSTHFRLPLSASLGVESQQWSNWSRFFFHHFVGNM